jgi:soluble lytic murein transglycosylase-like protein
MKKLTPILRAVYVCELERDSKVGRHQVSHDIHHLPVAGVQGGLDMRKANWMVHATKGMDPPGSIPQQRTRRILADGLRQEVSQRGGLDAGQIAGDDQVKWGGCSGQGRFQAGEWALASAKISPALPSKGTVLRLSTQKDRGSSGLLHHTGNVRNQRRMRSKRKQCFVLPHTRTAASDEDESGRSHDRMVASESFKSGYNRKNKVRPFCFIVACGLLCGSLLAADAGSVNATSSRHTAAPGLVSVVRVGRDGRLVRVVATPPAAVKPPAKAEKTAAVVSIPETNLAAVTPAVQVMPIQTNASQTIEALIEDASNRYRVDPLLVKLVMQVESNFNPAAVSPKGAQGLMQLIPATAQRFGVTDPFDSKQNIEGGVKYLRYLQDLFPSDLRLSLAAYNAGEGAVAKYGAVPPYRETVDYVQKVHQRYSNAKGSAVAKIAPILEPEEPTEPPVRHIEQVVDSEGRLFLRTR